MTKKYQFNDTLLLSIQLGDRAANVATTRVFCELRNPSGVVIEPLFEMSHISDGLYIDVSKTMPGLSEITAHYYINEIDGVTPSNKYDPNVYMEQIMRDFTGEIVEENLDKKVSEVSVSTIEVIGEVNDDNELSAQMPDDDILQGNLENDLILEGDILDEC